MNIAIVVDKTPQLARMRYGWRALVDTLRTLPELRLVVMRYPQMMKRQHIGEMLWQRKTEACSA